MIFKLRNRTENLGFSSAFGSLILTIVFLKWKTSNKKKSMWSLVGIVLIIFTVTAATEANYSHKIQSYKGRLVMTKKMLHVIHPQELEAYMTMHH